MNGNATTPAQLCSICRRTLPECKSDLVGSSWDAQICETCCRKRLLDDGGIMVRFVQQPEGAAFEINDIHIKPGALHYLIESREHCWTHVTEHARANTQDETASSAGIVRLPFLEISGNRATEHKTATGKRLWIMTDQNGLTVVTAPGEF